MLTIMEGSRFGIQDYHLLWSAFPDRFAGDTFVTPRRPVWDAYISTRNPGEQAHRFGLDPLSLAATYGVSVDFLSCRY